MLLRGRSVRIASVFFSFVFQSLPMRQVRDEQTKRDEDGADGEQEGVHGMHLNPFFMIEDKRDHEKCQTNPYAACCAGGICGAAAQERLNKRHAEGE